MLRDDLSENETPKRGDICLYMADSLHCTAETNSTVNQLNPNKKIEKNKKQNKVTLERK